MTKSWDFSPRACRWLRQPDPDWEFFLPDDEEAAPEPGDFWIETEREED